MQGMSKQKSWELRIVSLTAGHLSQHTSIHHHNAHTFVSKSSVLLILQIEKIALGVKLFTHSHIEVYK